jgi:hypothetical protein
MTFTPVPGDRIHALQAFIFGDVALRRGDTLILTKQHIELSFNTLGESSLSIADDDDAQVAKWGNVMIGVGEFPQGVSPFVAGSADEDVERERRRQIAWANTNEDERRAELRAIRDEFGSAKTSRTLHEYK